MYITSTSARDGQADRWRVWKTSSHKRRNRILVTGGAGFIGSHLVEGLLDRGHLVTVLDNLSSGRIENVPRNPHLEFVSGDVNEFDLVKQLVQRAELVFHLAEFIPNTEQYGYGHIVKFSSDKPLVDFDLNLRGTLNVIEAARERRVKTIFASTAAVYGESSSGPIKENSAANPVSPYGASKLAGEIYCNLYKRLYDLPVVIVRLFNVYGPRQRKYIMYDLLARLSKTSTLLALLGTGEERRDFVYVKDVVDGLIYLSSKPEACGQTFNIGTGVSTSIKRLVAEVSEFLSSKPSVSYTGKSWSGDIPTLVADVTKLHEIGFHARTTLRKGLTELILWYQQNKKPSEKSPFRIDLGGNSSNMAAYRTRVSSSYSRKHKPSD